MKTLERERERTLKEESTPSVEPADAAYASDEDRTHGLEWRECRGEIALHIHHYPSLLLWCGMRPCIFPQLLVSSTQRKEMPCKRAFAHSDAAVEEHNSALAWSAMDERKHTLNLSCTADEAQPCQWMHLSQLFSTIAQR